jgi:hypothetical protein
MNLLILLAAVLNLLIAPAFADGFYVYSVSPLPYSPRSH